MSEAQDSEWVMTVPVDLAVRKDPKDLVHFAAAFAIERVGPMIHAGFRIVTVKTEMEGEDKVILRLGVSRG